MLEPQRALHHRVVLIEVAITEAAVSDEEVDDEPQEDNVGRKGSTALLLGKAAPETTAQAQASNQRLEDHERARKRRSAADLRSEGRGSTGGGRSSLLYFAS